MKKIIEEIDVDLAETLSELEKELLAEAQPVKAVKEKKKKNYVNNGDLLNALVDYREKANYAIKHKLPAPPIPNYIGECWMLIAEKFSHNYKYVNYPFREEMISDGIENCLMYFHNFDPAKSKNPFAYFTQIIYFAFLRRIAKEKKQLYVKYKATQQMGILNEDEIMELEDGSTRQFQVYDNIAEFIENFEDAKRKKAEKKPAKKPKGLDKFMKE